MTRKKLLSASLCDASASDRERQEAFYRDMEAFRPETPQEENDKALALGYVRLFPDTILLRENTLIHITPSALLFNPSLTKVLMIYHNLRNAWAWTGGHADGDPDLLAVALREAREETGGRDIAPLKAEIASVEILPVFGHVRRGSYVSAHLHLAVAYLLTCGENGRFSPKRDEASALRWFDAEDIAPPWFDTHDTRLYQKLIRRARKLQRQ